MGGLSIWHWFIVLLVLGIPTVIGLITWLLIRASRRPSAVVMPAAIPASPPSLPGTLDPSNPYAPPQSLTHSVALSPVPSTPRPWVRYWARMFDIYLACLVAGVAVGILTPDVFGGPGRDQLFAIGVVFAWIFIESLFLSTAGTTPGKWLLKTRVIRASGIKPDYSMALSRSFKVWWRGLGIGLPLASLVTLLVAHGKLTRDGITTWDRDDGFIVVHERIGPLRVLAAIVAFLGLLLLAVLGTAESL